eukprot:NODE_487_length_2043_cov_8.470913_g384_i0.p1 GENE.NODE_487_length_2043_cov_8.470913_g384_i0~~NODE_487_length_2043_cov_8.470913_g384_i0.p1  ORF type:complete len:653 (-),score=137.25 NODE_487_length_2043_cov_8.470913_g384_i0:84-1856(-)
MGVDDATRFMRYVEPVLLTPKFEGVWYGDSDEDEDEDERKKGDPDGSGDGNPNADSAPPARSPKSHRRSRKPRSQLEASTSFVALQQLAVSTGATMPLSARPTSPKAGLPPLLATSRASYTAPAAIAATPEPPITIQAARLAASSYYTELCSATNFQATKVAHLCQGLGLKKAKSDPPRGIKGLLASSKGPVPGLGTTSTASPLEASTSFAAYKAQERAAGADTAPKSQTLGASLSGGTHPGGTLGVPGTTWAPSTSVHGATRSPSVVFPGLEGPVVPSRQPEKVDRTERTLPPGAQMIFDLLYNSYMDIAPSADDWKPYPMSVGILEDLDDVLYRIETMSLAGIPSMIPRRLASLLSLASATVTSTLSDPSDLDVYQDAALSAQQEGDPETCPMAAFLRNSRAVPKLRRLFRKFRAQVDPSESLDSPLTPTIRVTATQAYLSVVAAGLKDMLLSPERYDILATIQQEAWPPLRAPPPPVERPPTPPTPPAEPESEGTCSLLGASPSGSVFPRLEDLPPLPSPDAEENDIGLRRSSGSTSHPFVPAPSFDAGFSPFPFIRNLATAHSEADLPALRLLAAAGNGKPPSTAP